MRMVVAMKLLKYDNVKITSSKLAILNCNEIKYILNNISGQHLIMIKKEKKQRRMKE